ncbi:class I SAM-dependent methyltransferase [Thioalkalivibrio nitratireducens]|uniref:class I SAM-dependent methyltransferase n=1 Tax=Thioalkalivibrio nitratireducens TaxID=186931 RepID=UPI0005C23C42|nr:class I SAM-dependent methyltransferase [Thioalkalivibrio nitratireducens]
MWDQRYGTDEYVYGTEPNEFLREAVGNLPRQGRALCLAEGEGRNAVFLAEQGFEVHAVDASPVGLAKAKRLAVQRGVRIDTEVADLDVYRIEPESWHLIVSIFCHLPAPVRRTLHRQVVQGLRPGGRLILEAYTPAQLALGTGGPSDASLMMTLDELRTELAGLEFEHAREYEREVHEGRLHTGHGAVVQVVAVRPLGNAE